MIKYAIRAFTPEGAFAYGATFRAEDDGEARRKFEALPIGEHRCELYRGKRRVAVLDNTRRGGAPLAAAAGA